MFGFLKRLEGDGPTAARQQGDVHALDREGDPRGGPGGAPQEGTTAEERRAADRPDDA